MFGNSAGVLPEAGKIPERLMYPTEEVAALLGGVTPRYVTQLIAEGTLPSIKLGRLRMVEHDALLAFVAELRRADNAVREAVGASS